MFLGWQTSHHATPAANVQLSVQAIEGIEGRSDVASASSPEVRVGVVEDLGAWVDDGFST